jgi:hypothetical protein
MATGILLTAFSPTSGRLRTQVSTPTAALIGAAAEHDHIRAAVGPIQLRDELG